MTFVFTVESLPGRAGVRVSVSRHGQALSHAAALQHWQHEPAFVDRFVDELHRCPFPAYFFETPPLTTATLGQAFEFVLIDAPSLARVRANGHAFRAKLDPREQTSTFGNQPLGREASPHGGRRPSTGGSQGREDNLGGDALLVVPCDHGADYAHLASFIRTGARTQVHALWRAAAMALMAECGTTPRWLSSSGLGVPWLHLRIDVRPKYYSHGPYRVARCA